MSISFSLQEPNLTIPPLIKQEVKLEPGDTPRIQLPPSAFYLEDPVIKKQSTFSILLSHILNAYPMVKVTETQVPIWSLVMPDQINLGDLINHKLDNKTPKPQKKVPFRIEKKPKEVKKLKEKKLEQERKETAQDNNVKLEEGMENKEKSKDEGKVKSPKEEAPKKKPQNRIKNVPGLVVQRVRSSIKTFFSQDGKSGELPKRLGYVNKVLGGMGKTERAKLSKFLDEYDKSWKTWNTIQLYMKKNIRYGTMLLDVVIEFFREDGLEDFQEWLQIGKMCTKTKEAVIEMKERIYRKYCKLLDVEDKEGDEVSEPHDKMVKKEEQ